MCHVFFFPVLCLPCFDIHCPHDFVHESCMPLGKIYGCCKILNHKKQSRLTINPLCYCSLCCQQSVLCAFIIFFCFTLKQKKTRLQSIMQLSVVKSRWFFRQEMIQYSLSSRLSTVYSNIRMYYWYIPVPVSFQMF